MEEVLSTPKVVVSLVERNGSFVLIQRQAPLRGRDWRLEWMFPGGLLKPGETDEEAAVRETLEEVGLNVEVIRLLHERKHPQTLVPMAYYACRLVDINQEPIVGQPREIVRVEWVSAREVLERFESFGLDVDPVAREYVMSFIQQGGKEQDSASNGNTNPKR